MPSRCPAAPTDQRREPEHTVLYQTVQTHLQTFLGQTAGDAERALARISLASSSNRTLSVDAITGSG